MNSQEILKLEYSELKQLEFIPSQHDPRYQATEDLKDPCVTQAQGLWHLYGSIGSSRQEVWQIFHAIADNQDGPWVVQAPVKLVGIGELLGVVSPHIAAPSVVYDPSDQGFPFHMTVQTEFLHPDGKILHLHSADGHTFENPKIILHSISTQGSSERGIYDPHFAVIGGQKYLSYSGAEHIGFARDSFMADPDIFLAKSSTNTWAGPWERCGRILSHEDIPHHNPRNYQEYEWGLEGSQLLELAPNLVLLVAVCFKPNESRGLRQRIFFAVSHQVTGPYRTLGIAIEPSSTHNWNTGENGHAMAEIYHQGQSDAFLRLWHQGRPRPDVSLYWSHRYADFPLSHILELADRALKNN